MRGRGTRPGSRAVVLAALVWAGATACGDAGSSDTDRPSTVPAVGDAARPVVTDAEGRVVELPAPAARVVSLVPSITATIRALGAVDRLVARTDFDDADDLADLPSVGGGLGPNLESLAALDPDLVIRFGGASDRATPDRLDDLGIAHAAMRPDRIDDVLREVRQIGVLLGLQAEADSLGAELRAGLEAVRSAVAGRPTVRAAYLMGGSPPWTAGPGTYIGELIALGGGDNVFGDLDRQYGAVSPEQVATREIDVILLADGAEVDPRLLDGRTVRRLPPSLELPGPDLVRSAWAMARALHPDLADGGRP